MRDFTSGKSKNSSPGESSSSSTAANPGFTFNGLSPDDDTTAVGALQNAIAGKLGPLGVAGISFVDPPELIDARARIRRRENTFMHISDGTSTGVLCGSIIQNAPSPGSPECPVCEILDC